MNLNSEFSINKFIDYLKNLDHNKQKRMLFMIEAELTIFDDFDYNTNFGVYPNYQHIAFDKVIRTPYYKNYNLLYVYLADGNLLSVPDDSMREKWNVLKDQFLTELNLDQSMFDHEYETFKFGLKLKELRQKKNISKSEFSKISGLNKQKITQVEDFGFLSKISEVNQYIGKGLKMSLNLNIK